MEKNRQIKMMFIVALVLSVTAMTLGFAAFSSALNILSSATVTPNADAFKVRLVGINGDNKFEVSDTNTSGNVSAIINDDGVSVSGLTAKLSKPGDYVRFHGIIENIGEYDAYFVEAKLNNLEGTDSGRRCEPIGDNGVSLENLDELCGKIVASYGIYAYEGEVGAPTLTTKLSYGDALEKGEKYILRYTLRYAEGSAYADGDFEVVMGDANFKFSSVSENDEI